MAGVPGSVAGDYTGQSGGTSISVLVDFSESFAPLTGDDEDALRVIANLILSKAKTLPKPVIIYWLRIGTSSLSAPNPCGLPFEFAPKLIAGVGKTNQIHRSEDLRVRLNECIRAIRKESARPDKYTDISGAIQAAAEATQGGFSQRFMFILSDFVEDRAPGDPPVRYVLRGERIALVYRPEPQDQRDQNKVLARLEEWRQRLAGAGAAKVCRRPVKGLTVRTLTECMNP